MGSIWLLILIVISPTNSELNVNTEVHWPNDPGYNTEQLCNEAGKGLAERLQKDPATTGNSVVYWQCHSANLDSMLKGAGKAASSAPKANGQEL